MNPILTAVIWCGIGGCLLALVGTVWLVRDRLLDWIADFEETINLAVSSVTLRPASDWAGPTMQLPVVEVPWEQRRARYAAYVDTFAARVRAMHTPTAEYCLVVQQQFGIQLGTVGPREADIQPRRLVWTDGAWELDLEQVS